MISGHLFNKILHSRPVIRFDGTRRGMLDPVDPAHRHRPDRPNQRTSVVSRHVTDVTPRDLTSTRIATYVTLPSLRAALWHVARAACGVPCRPRSLSIIRATDKWLKRFAHACFRRSQRDKATAERERRKEPDGARKRQIGESSRYTYRSATLSRSSGEEFTGERKRNRRYLICRYTCTEVDSCAPRSRDNHVHSECALRSRDCG